MFHWCEQENMMVLATIPFVGIYFRRIYFWFANLLGIKQCNHNHKPSKEPWYVIAIFDKEGRYTSVKAPTPTEVKEIASNRMKIIPGLVVCSTPFPGVWIKSPLGTGSDVVDTTLPSDYKNALGVFDR